MTVPVEVNALVQAAVNVIAFVIGLAASAGLLAKVIVWVKQKFADFEASQPENIKNLIEWAVLIAAQFAEKLDLSGQLNDYAHSKKELALEYAHKLLLSLGFDISMDALDAALEALLFAHPEMFPSSGG